MHHRIARPGTATRILIAGILVCIVVVVVAIARGKAEPQLYRQSQFLMDTFVELTVASSNEQEAQKAMSEAYAEMRRIEVLLSKYRNESQVTRINQRAGEEQYVSITREVSDILQRSLHYSAITDGSFDITVGSMIDLWGIGTDHERVPDESEIQHLLPSVDYRNVELQTDQGIRLRYPEMRLDLGGIAKGYSIDRAIEVLQAHQITSALLNAGGDIRCLGVKPDGTSWRIGVQHPRESGILGVIELQNTAVATSGDYERYFLHQGIRYHHLFHPSTGQPARECQSVTILAGSAEVADVFATAVFIMGPVRGLEFIEEQPQIEGMIVRIDGEIISSSGFVLKAK